MNSYDKLRPWTTIERCVCPDVTGLLLVDILTDNPIHCLACKYEIDAEHLGIDPALVEDIAHWFRVNQALNALWLNSGEYETYAVEKLTDKNSQVNIEGMSLAKQLSEYYPTYYWWFHDRSDESNNDPTHCPNCDQALDQTVVHGTGKCDACRIVI